MDDTDIRELNNSINEIKLDIREIKTILTEREKTTLENRANIGQAFEEIKELRSNLQQNISETQHISQRQEIFEQHLGAKIDKLSEQIEKLNEAYEKMGETKHQNKIMWGVFFAVVTGIFLTLLKFIKG
jgi:methyl-accepting chemotaxis protein